jgi:hypothetical protein
VGKKKQKKKKRKEEKAFVGVESPKPISHLSKILLVGTWK